MANDSLRQLVENTFSAITKNIGIWYILEAETNKTNLGFIKMDDP